MTQPIFHGGAWWQQQPDGSWWWWNEGGQRWELWQGPASGQAAGGYAAAPAQPADATQERPAPAQPTATEPAATGNDHAPTGNTRAPAAGITDANALQERLRAMLISMFGGIELVKDEILTLPVGSTRLFVRALQIADDVTGVNVYAITNLEVPASPDLFRFIATQSGNAVFGHVVAVEREGKVDIVLAHRLLGNHLDEMEFESAVQVVAGSADEIDDVIRERFGGRTFHESLDDHLKESADAASTGGYL